MWSFQNSLRLNFVSLFINFTIGFLSTLKQCYLLFLYLNYPYLNHYFTKYFHHYLLLILLHSHPNFIQCVSFFLNHCLNKICLKINEPRKSNPNRFHFQTLQTKNLKILLLISHTSAYYQKLCNP